MTRNNTILPGEGLDDIKFGHTGSEVEAALGPADTVEIIDYAEDGAGLELSWRYNELGLTLGFYQDEPFRLGSIEADRADYLLRGKSFLGKSVEEIEGQLFELGIGNFNYEDLSDGLVLIEIDELSLSFVVSDGECVEIQWGYFWDEAGNPIWFAGG